MDGSKLELTIRSITGEVVLARTYAKGNVEILDQQPHRFSEQVVKAAAGYLKSRKEGIVEAKLPDGSRLVYYPPEADPEAAHTTQGEADVG